MEHSMTRDHLYARKTSLFEKIAAIFFTKKSLTEQLDDLRAGHAVTLDQCQLMQAHIQNLETKIDKINSALDFRSEAGESQMSYSSAILLVKKGCGKEEIRQACGLTDSEADLIVALHKRAEGDPLRSDRSAAG